MKLHGQVKSISYLKSHAADIVRDLGRDGEPLIITQNGEARAVIQGVEDYERTQESLALLKILALGAQEYEAGLVTPAADVVARIRERRVTG